MKGCSIGHDSHLCSHHCSHPVEVDEVRGLRMSVAPHLSQDEAAIPDHMQRLAICLDRVLEAMHQAPVLGNVGGGTTIAIWLSVR